ncbi:MAG: hypothetical protein RIQ52_2076 [Pseudomonadota bacterium]|jgi:hypothetical protein
MKKTLMTLSTLLFSATLAAEPSPPAPAASKLDPAWMVMQEKVSGVIGAEKQHAMVDLAYATVAGDVCDNLDINEKSLDEEFQRFAADLQKKSSAEEQRRIENGLMGYFGIYVGLVVAESLNDTEAFCKEVSEVRKRGGGPTRYWVTPEPVAPH